MAALASAGCSVHQGEQGERGVSAAYRCPTLRADLPASARVPAVMAAAESAMLSRGYAIRSRSITADRGTIEALAPHADADESITIIASVAGEGSRCRVTVGKWGDEAVSRAILDGILVRLGL